jgi:CRP-like cAMP-binding protein
MLTAKFLLGRRRGELSSEELQSLEATVSRVAAFKPGETIVRAGEPLTRSNFLLNGLVSRNIDNQDGQRQIVGLHVAGDFVDLHGFPLGKLDHDVVALCPVELAYVPHEALTRITVTHPHLTRLLWFSTMIDAAIHREWVFRNSCLSAVKRMANFFCEMNRRLEFIGLSDGKGFTLALTQVDLGDACGLTSVHVNRVLRELRERELMLFKGGGVTILDRKALESFGEFDPAYLYGDGTVPARG